MVVTVGGMLAGCSGPSTAAPRTTAATGAPVPASTAATTAATTTTARPRSGARCAPPWSGGAADLVDTATGARFPRQAVVCLEGYVYPVPPPEDDSYQLIEGGRFYVALDTGRVARVALARLSPTTGNEGAVTYSEQIDGLEGIALVTAQAVWVNVSASGGAALWELSPQTLAPLWKLDGVAQVVSLGGRLWAVDGAGRLIEVDPTSKSVSVLGLGLPAGTSIEHLGAGGGLLHMSLAMGTGTGVANYDPAGGRLSIIATTGETYAEAAAGPFLWVFPEGGTMSEVFPGTVTSVSPGAGRYACGGVNGWWFALVAPTELWCETFGNPVVCVSGVTGAEIGAFKLPGTSSPRATPPYEPELLAAGDGVIVVTGGNQAQPRTSLALYRVDPRCSVAAG